MKDDDAPEVVDLGRYKAAQAAAKAKEKAQKEAQAKLARRAAKTAGGQSFLGSRPKAGMILALVILAIAILFILPKFLG
ncbi:hypothetical protein [Phenylobacterium sp.]|uniref:hypothetical protein n=1 Tax=Phenylobacterium sp. TaxID=1871053 RepID=UPI0035B1404B